MERIKSLIKEWNATELVVGIPVNIDGSEQAITQHAKNFAVKLQQQFKLPVHPVDERLTTKAARQHVFDEGGYKALQKAEIDSVAAMLIVEQYLRSLH